MRQMRVRLVLLLACMGLVLFKPTALGAADEYPVKAAFIFNFVQFVEWPASAFGGNPKAPLEIAIVGNDPFNGTLDRVINGKPVNGHPLAVKHFASASEARPCQVMFFAAGSQDQFDAAMQKTGKANILTIGEADGFVDAGGVIHLFADGNHIRFDINRGAAEHAGLHISAKLLKLAKTVVN